MCCFDLGSWCVLRVGPSLCMTMFRGKSVTELHIPVWLCLWVSV